MAHNPDAADADWNDDFCSVCKQLGDVLCCDGTCLRAFHAACLEPSDVPSASDNEGMLWFCPMCRDGWAVCADCGEVGLAESELFQCSVQSCGASFHLSCLRKRPHGDIRWQVGAASTMAATTSSGVRRPACAPSSRSLPPFVCPSHACAACRQPVPALGAGTGASAAMRCLNCPTCYHARCLPPNTYTAGDRNILCLTCVLGLASAVSTGAPLGGPARHTGVAPTRVVEKVAQERLARASEAAAMAATTGDLGDRLTEDAVAEVMAAVHAGVAAAADVSPQGAAAPSSGVRVICHGVEPIVGTGLWLSTVPVRGVLRAVGHFRGADAAARAHDMMMLRLWPSLAPSTLNFPIAEYAEGSPWMAAYTRGERARPSPQAADARGIAAPTASAPAESTPGVALVDMRCKTVPDALAREEVDASCLGDDKPSSSGGGGRGADALAAVLPDCLPVVCGTARGQLLTESMTVLLDGGSSQVSIGDFVRLGYKGHLAGQLELVHAVMDDGSLGASLDYWIAGCPKGTISVTGVQGGSTVDGSALCTEVWTWPVERPRTRPTNAATVALKARPPPPGGRASAPAAPSISRGPAGTAAPSSMSKAASSGVATDRGDWDQEELSPEARPRKRGRPARPPQQGDDGAGERQYRGVKWLRRREQWSAFITYEGDLQPLGTFDTAEAAARAYDWAALDLYGRRALLNFSREQYQTSAPSPPAPGAQSSRAADGGDSAADRRSTYMGVSWNARSGLWSAYATQRAGRGRKQRTEIGAYRGEEEAARAYDRFVLDTQGPRAITNFPAADYAGATA